MRTHTKEGGFGLCSIHAVSNGFAWGEETKAVLDYLSAVIYKSTVVLAPLHPPSLAASGLLVDLALRVGRPRNELLRLEPEGNLLRRALDGV